MATVEAVLPQVRADQPTAINFSATRHYHRGKFVDHLSTCTAASVWIGAMHHEFGQLGPVVISANRLAMLRHVRASVVAAFEVAMKVRVSRAQLRLINTLHLAASRVPQLRASEDSIEVIYGADEFEHLVAKIYFSAVACVVDSSPSTALRRCPYRRCQLYFMPISPQQTWCEPRCGNRARVSRCS
jgi:predicted RNA-binding Zn ribbon-like protein